MQIGAHEGRDWWSEILVTIDCKIRSKYRCTDARASPMNSTLFDNSRSGDFAFLALCEHIAAEGLQIDAEGWAEVPYVLRALKSEGHILSRFEFERIVASDPARRFALSADRRRIRAVPPQAARVTTSAVLVAAE